MVNVYNGGFKRMDELAVGDWVQALDKNGSQVTFIPVQYWLHRDPKQVADFVE